MEKRYAKKVARSGGSRRQADLLNERMGGIATWSVAASSSGRVSSLTGELHRTSTVALAADHA